MDFGLKLRLTLVRIVVLATIGSLAGAADLRTAELAGPSHSSLIVEVASVLNASPGKHDPLPDLAKVIKNFDPSHLDELVNAISEADFTSIHDAILAHTSVLQPKSAVQLGDIPDWSYGSYQARQGLRELMWAQSKKIAKTDPAKGRAYARAAILFYAMDEFRVGPYGVKTFLTDKDGLIVAGIDGAKAQALVSSIEARSRGIPASTPPEKAIDRLFKHPQPQEFRNAVNALQGWFKSQPDESEQYEFALAVRQLFNHAAASGDGKIQSDVNDAISAWKKSGTTTLHKWLDEATSTASEPKRVYDLTIWKDGRWVDTDTDCNPLQ